MKKGILILMFLTALTANAQSVTKNICVGKAAKIFQARYQLSHLIVNGVSSRRSTFYYKGQHSKLILDFDKANVVAKCHSAGSDLYSFTYSINGQSSMHRLLGRVNCIHCLKTSIQKLQKQIRIIGSKLAETKNPELKQKLRERLLKLLKKLLKEVEKELKNEKLPEELREKLEQMKQVLSKLIQHVLEGDVDSELFFHYLAQL